MSLAKRVRRHPWTSCAVIAVGAVLAVAGCGAGFGGSKAASSSRAPSVAHSYGEPSHGAVEAREPTPERPGLGTSWGEALDAPLHFTAFDRASAAPWAELVMHYNDSDGVTAYARHLGSRPAPIDERSESGGRGPAGFAGGEGVCPLSIDRSHCRIPWQSHQLFRR
jgi:hypothetical protein